jgi:hypothetical protein
LAPTLPLCTSPKPTRPLDATNFITEPGLEKYWGEDNSRPGQWTNAYWSAYPNYIPNSIFPNPDSFEGCYSALIEGHGAEATFSQWNHPIPAANKRLQLTFYYKTLDSVQVIINVGKAGGTGAQYEKSQLNMVNEWTQKTIEFDMPSSTDGTSNNVDFWMWFVVTGTGKVWVDDFQLVAIN